MFEPTTGHSNQLQVRVFQTGADFVDICEEWLYSAEAANHGLLSISSLTENSASLFKPPFWYAAIMNYVSVEGAAVFARPDGLCLSDMKSDSAKILVEAFMESGIVAERLSGSEESCALVAEAFKTVSGLTYQATTGWQTFIATKPIMPKRAASGVLRRATEADRDVVIDFGTRYGNEKPAVVDVATFFLRKLADQDLWAWDDNGIKTLVSVSGRTRNGIGVSGVFTPPEYRGNGYAAAAVYQVSKHFIEQGKEFCTLVVDKVDPHVMRIYEKIGYEERESRLEMRLQK